MKDDLGDQIKAIEELGDRKLMPGLPVIARLDGVAFHTFTRGFRRPYDEDLSKCMIETAEKLVSHFNATVAYTQSDEITLAWKDIDDLYAGRISKLESIIASTATVWFNALLRSRFDTDITQRMPVFDCRVRNYPNLDLAGDVFTWREWDATKNSISMAASSVYSPSELHGKSQNERLDMLLAKGINWNHYPNFFKRGTYIAKRTRMVELTQKQLERIPEDKRPTGPVERTSHMAMFFWEPINKWVNRNDVLFEHQDPKTDYDVLMEEEQKTIDEIYGRNNDKT